MANDRDSSHLIADTGFNGTLSERNTNVLRYRGQVSNSQISRSGNDRKLKFSREVLRIALQVLMFIFTDWPWETVKKAVKFSVTNTDQKKIVNNFTDASTNADTKPSSTKCSIMWTIWTLLRLTFIAGGLALQVITCFRRDLISTDLVPIPNTNTTRLICDKRNEVIRGLLIPAFVVFLVAFWVYVVLKFSYKRKCCKWLGWKELTTATKADTAATLNKLVNAVQSELKVTLLVKYSLFPSIYIILSQGVSVVYLILFQLWDEDVIIQMPLGHHDLDKSKRWLLCSAIIGFIAFDLLYVRVVMRYVYQCQMIIYYLKMIKHKVKHNEHCNHKEAIEEVKKAKKFIRHLNASSGTTGFVTIIGLFQAVNCAFFLLSDEITYHETGAIMARLILFGFLAIYPFYKAAGLNVAAERLCDTGLDMHIYSPYQESKKDVRITLKATMFGIYVQPWLPYLVLFVIFLTALVESRLKWYQIVL